MKFFNSKNNETKVKASSRKDFEYMSEDTIYLDSACQTQRPQPVVDAMTEYFSKYNACGGRVKYEWGKKVDEYVAETRIKILNFIGKSKKEYVVSFTLNTTYGLNLLLQQLPIGKYKQMITSEIEHNSVFLSTITASKRLNIPRKILSRNIDGSLIYEKQDLSGAIVVVNMTSNIDGRVLQNAKKLADDVHGMGGILIIDGAQSMVGEAVFMQDVDFDALCFSGHKTYGPSIGVIVVKKQLIDALELSFVGGGMVKKLTENSFSFPDEDIVCKLEPGLQDFAGIIGLGASIDWLKNYKPEGLQQVKQKFADLLFREITSLKGVHLLNIKPSSTISFYSENVDSHRLATFLSQQNIMVRSGYFCCHYYLQNVKKYPPLLRISLGLHNTEKDVEKFIKVLKEILKNIK